MQTLELVKGTLSHLMAVAEQQMKLLRLEATEQLLQERRMLVLVGIGAGVILGGVVMLLVAAAMGLGVALGGRHWAGSLVLAAPLLLLGAILCAAGWRQRVRTLLPLSSLELDKELKWAQTNLS
jgi:Putative Actinobacterial Holin-X, holin superfamily III